MSFPEITLRNGARTPAAIVKTIFVTVEILYDENYDAWCAAVAVARDPSCVPVDGTRKILTGLGLLNQDGTVPQAQRDVIVSSAEGGGDDLRLVTPYARGETE